jgi:hypothetical protein
MKKQLNEFNYKKYINSKIDDIASIIYNNREDFIRQLNDYTPGLNLFDFK